MVYKYKIPELYKSSKVSAQTVGEVFERLEERDGLLTKESVLEEARPEDSELHPIFEWNDTVAAEKYRLTQSAQLIRSLVVISEETKPSPFVAYVNVSPGKKRSSFININAAMEKAESRQTVLNNALAELTEIQNKYNSLQELAELFRELEKVKESIA